MLHVTEGLAVGVGFGAVGKTPSSTFAKARYVLHLPYVGLVRYFS